MLSIIEKKYFDELFNRGGYVLDFSTDEFDNFTKESIGIALCETYGLSKGKSLREFLNSDNDFLKAKLLNELLNYYQVFYIKELKGEVKTYSGTTYKALYDKCREITNRELSSTQNFSKTAQNLKKSFSTEYMNRQINLMLEMIEENPTESIGKAKELMESCCKQICIFYGETDIQKIELPKLVKMTFKCLKIPDETVTMDRKESEIVKQITGSLNGLSTGIVQLRNHYGSGHGRLTNFESLHKRHAQLAVGSSITLVQYLWDTHKYRLEYIQKEIEK